MNAYYLRSTTQSHHRFQATLQHLRVMELYQVSPIHQSIQTLRCFFKLSFLVSQIFPNQNFQSKLQTHSTCQNSKKKLIVEMPYLLQILALDLSLVHEMFNKSFSVVFTHTSHLI
jgi:hypothetical protein